MDKEKALIEVLSEVHGRFLVTYKDVTIKIDFKSLERIEGDFLDNLKNSLDHITDEEEVSRVISFLMSYSDY